MRLNCDKILRFHIFFSYKTHSRSKTKTIIYLKEVVEVGILSTLLK